jgi:SAM-dependent methyltransferase
MYRLNYSKERIADIGCGPADILRYVDPKCKPEYYLGIDISDQYMEQAKSKTMRLGVDADFIAIDLMQLPHSKGLQNKLISLMDEKNISTVLLLGLLHHIDDDSVTAMLNIFFTMPKVKYIITQDVLIIPGNSINNYFASRDRGNYVRNEVSYDNLINSTCWKIEKKFWTHPGLSSIKYIHYKLSRFN